jgi:hypothetical protein
MALELSLSAFFDDTVQRFLKFLDGLLRRTVIYDTLDLRSHYHVLLSTIYQLPIDAKLRADLTVQTG